MTTSGPEPTPQPQPSQPPQPAQPHPQPPTAGPPPTPPPPQPGAMPPPQTPQPGQQPPPPYQAPPPGAPDGDEAFGLGSIFLLLTAALGIVNLFLGFVGTGGGDRFGGGGGPGLYDFALATFSLVPTMLFLGGLAALRGFLPGEGRAGAWPALITTAIVVVLILSAIQGSSAGTAQPLFIWFGCVQFATAWLAYLFDNGVLKGARITFEQGSPRR